MSVPLYPEKVNPAIKANMSAFMKYIINYEKVIKKNIKLKIENKTQTKKCGNRYLNLITCLPGIVSINLVAIIPLKIGVFVSSIYAFQFGAHKSSKSR